METSERKYQEDNGSHFAGNATFDLSSTKAIEAVLNSIQGRKRQLDKEQQEAAKQAKLPRVIKPKRPLTAYNFFFQSERAKLLGIDLPTTNFTPQRKKRRKHRKTHGKIGFTELSQTISQKWRMLDDESRSFFLQKQEEDRLRYYEEMSTYDQQIKSMGRVVDTTGLQSVNQSVPSESLERKVALDHRNMEQERNYFLPKFQSLLNESSLGIGTIDTSACAAASTVHCDTASPPGYISGKQGEHYGFLHKSEQRNKNFVGPRVGCGGWLSAGAAEVAPRALETYLSNIRAAEKNHISRHVCLSEQNFIDTECKNEQASGKILKPLSVGNPHQGTIPRHNQDLSVVALGDNGCVFGHTGNGEQVIPNRMVGSIPAPRASGTRTGEKENNNNVFKLLNFGEGREAGFPILNITDSGKHYIAQVNSGQNISGITREPESYHHQQTQKNVVLEGERTTGNMVPDVLQEILRRGIMQSHNMGQSPVSNQANAPDHHRIMSRNFQHEARNERGHSTGYGMNTVAVGEQSGIESTEEQNVSVQNNMQKQPVLYTMKLVPLYPQQVEESFQS